MILVRKNQMLTILLTACFFVVSVVYAEQSEPAERQLKFEVSTIPVDLSYRFSEAKYVGYIHIREDRSLRSWRDWIQAVSQWKEMSEAQRQFINKLWNDYEYKKHISRADRGYPFSSKSVNTPQGTLTYRVIGVSEEDVRKMAVAVVEVLDHLARLQRENDRKDLERVRSVIAEAEKILPRLEAQVKQLSTRVDEKIAEYVEANYGIENKETIREHARKSMDDLSYNLRLVNFELIGLQAKIDSIEKYKSSRKTGDQDTLIKLEQMYIAADVERVGALARKGAYEAAFKQAKELYTVINSRDDVSVKKHEWEQKLSDSQEYLPYIEGRVASPPRETYPVEVYHNKVTIHPVLREN
jgi:hypothetical protein